MLLKHKGVNPQCYCSQLAIKSFLRLIRHYSCAMKPVGGSEEKLNVQLIVSMRNSNSSTRLTSQHKGNDYCKKLLAHVIKT